MKTFNLEISDLDNSILENDLLDVHEWIRLALVGKISSVKSRLMKEAQEALIRDPDIQTMPATEEGILELYFSRPYYKNRAQRDNLI